ncbi:molybdopterin-binding tetrapyrrole methyltransferase, putative [Syntrophotalea carbinolica DSM 2380]|uniref:Molybdopterin-binding tetrapyrrole methyltransferase, putative n=1 Tax=Syntrophotalea carbinolica (strain DSM 2380 / NBRC 103641 / GraBd1) TaxID=338963 RepID=Q3A840_SYNC1|nr:SAM-dependent methyltransferase [Syntrophotalea carbinolica]ABA87452.1 molybdopterin-binding tetrapyrrole methyltransferase, putative [Syntrophotalea carbinolica DSM 2380]
MRQRWRLVTIWMLCFFSLPAIGLAASQPVVTISGLVKHPQRLTLEDLSHYRPVTVRSTEVDRHGTFAGVHRYQGVPLQHLLQAAGVGKEAAAFPKAIDLAIEVRSRHGQRTLLSWAEVAYGRPGDAIVAFACTSLLTKNSQPKMQQPVALPRLVLSNDFYNDRCLQDIVSIEVIDPASKAEVQPMELAPSAELPVSEVATKIVWEGSRFEGVQRFSGTPLVAMLQQAGITDDPQAAVLVRSDDGYRSLISFGELFGSPLGRRILLADRMDGRLLGSHGEKWLVLPDSSANRFVRGITGIEVLRCRHKPKLTVVGVGPGDTCQMTLEALAALARADAIAAPGDIQKRYARYLSGKQVLFDPFAHADHNRKTPLTRTERDRLQKEEWRANAAKIRKALNAGKNVAFIDWGDPMIFGSSRWIREYFDEAEFDTVAGLSSFNAANAVINRDISTNGSIVITAPRGLRQNHDLLAAVAAKGETLAIFMGLPNLHELVPLLKQHYADTTPMRLVYAAGISNRQHQVATTLGEVLKAVENEKERFLGLVYIGPCLAKGAPSCP